jgi:hypothetical protein
MPLIGWFYDAGAPHSGEWIIFGAGALGISAHAQIARSGGTVLTYIDNAAEKQGTCLLGTPIAPAHELPFLLRHNVNLVVASAQYAAIVEQLKTNDIDYLWIGVTENPLDIPEKLGLDNREEIEEEILVYLPAEWLTKEVLDDYLANLQRTLGKPLTDLSFAAPPDWMDAYAELALPGRLQAQEIEHDARRFRSLVFFRGAFHADQWSWSPHSLALLTPRIYVLQPWGQLRCTNRLVTRHEHRQIEKHPFFRNTTHDNQSFLAFAPHIQLARDESFGPADEFGFRHPAHTHLENDDKSINVCLFGGSAAWGQGLPDQGTLAYQLQEKLGNAPHSPGAKTFRVYNFAQPAATVVGEIITFLLYAVAVKPHIVIAHDGFNDLYYGQQNDRNMLRAARYAYHPMLEQWSSLLHGAPAPRANGRIPPSPQQIVDSYAFRRDQFAQVTSAFGCLHIHGLQPYLDSRANSGGPREAAYRCSDLYSTQENRNMRRLYDQLKVSIPQAPWIDFDENFRSMIDAHDCFFDIVHPTAEGNARMADNYSQLIAAISVTDG